MVMAAVHEDVHERASQDGQPYQKPEYVRPVVGEQQRTRDDGKTRKNQRDARVSRYAARHLVPVMGPILQGH
jgi:hypothetical protein